MKETKFKQTEIGMIPDDWEVKNIGTTCDVFTGGEVPLKYSKDKNEVFKYPIYSNGRDVYGYYTGFVIGDDSVCISSIGENTGDVFFYKGEFTPVIRLKVVVPKSNKISTKYLYYYLKAHKIDGTKNGGIPNINANDVKILNFPLPPTLAEQQKIAKALSDVDNVISTLEKLITKKKNLKQGTMQQLLTGKKRLPGFSKSNKFKQTEIGEIPEDWEVKELGEISEIIGGGTPNTEKREYWNGKIQWFTPAEITNSFKYVGESEKSITLEGLNNSSAKLLPKGSILLTTRASIGNAAILLNEACTNQGFQSLIAKKDIMNSEYLYYLIPSIVPEMYSRASGSTFLEISSKKMKTINISIPSKPEQNAIANVLSSMDKEIEALVTKLGKYRNLKTGMMQQLLTGKIRLV